MSKLLEGSGHRGRQHRHQVLHEGFMLELRATPPSSATAHARAVRDCAQDEAGRERESLGAYLVADVGHPGREEVVHLVSTRTLERGGDVGIETCRILLDQLGEDDEEAPSPPAARGELRRGT